MIATRESLEDRLISCGIPDHMHDGLIEWILNARPVGNFLTAVLENDLKEACKRADLTNQRKIYDYVFFLYNYAPIGCWGSPETVKTWAAHRGLAGIDSANDARRI